MPAPSVIAAEKAALIDVYEEMRRDLAYLSQITSAQLGILQNEPDAKIRDTVVEHEQIVSDHVTHLSDSAAAAALIVADILVILP